MSNALSPVNFHGDTIFCTTYQNQPYTAMKPIIENMGLAWQPQARKLTACKERWGITIMVIPTSSGEQETLCMPVRKLPAFLNTINPKKVRPELRERIELYQTESDDVLWEYWTNQQKAPTLSTVADRRPLNILVHAWAQKSDQKYSKCWKQVNSAFGLAKAAEFPAHWIPDAVAWVQEKIDALPEKKALPHPSQLLDLTLDTPIGYKELLDALASITWRLEKTCQCELDAEFEKGLRLFSKATQKGSRLDFMLAASLVGPKHATLEMLKSALRIAETAYKTHFLVCEAGK